MVMVATESRKVRAVEISGCLWQEMITKGWLVGRDHIVECIDGLPDGAKFVSVHFKHYDGRTVTPSLIFIFQHDDFDEVRPGDLIPEMQIVFHEHHNSQGKE